jgi:D,D-heptose 1,7-bisphosphate phosphatase
MIAGPDAPEQAVILIGGQGAPDALREISGRAFLDYLVETCMRFGFRDILLLAGGEPEMVAAFIARTSLPPGHTMSLVVEPRPLGSAGAIRHAADRLHERFLLLDSDSLFDSNWLDLMLVLSPDTLAVMALRRVSIAPRAVALNGERVTGFGAPGRAQAGLTDGGVCLLDRRIVPLLPEAGSLGETVLPALAERGLVRGRVQDGFFLDIGAPEGRALAQVLPTLWRRPAVFFDRDGTLNADSGYTHRPQDLVFLPGAVAAVKRVNDLGYYAFLVTNQSGVARGYFTEADTQAFNAHLQRKLRAGGAHIDDIRYCPDHPDGTVARYRRASDWRKPAPGMLLDLMNHWPVRREGSVVVGDQASDIQAAEAAGLRGLLYAGGRLDDFLAPHLPKIAPAKRDGARHGV